jgi:hypothetical protein
VEKEARQGQARCNATSEPELSVRLRSLKESSLRVSAETGPQSVGKGPGPLRQDLPLLAPVTQKRLERWNLARGKLWHSVSSCFWFPISSLARVTSFFHLHLICLHPFVLVPSLLLLLALSFQKFRTFACRSELLLLTISLMGVNAARTALARGGDVATGHHALVSLVCPH